MHILFIFSQIHIWPTAVRIHTAMSKHYRRSLVMLLLLAMVWPYSQRWAHGHMIKGNNITCTYYLYFHKFTSDQLLFTSTQHWVSVTAGLYICIIWQHLVIVLTVATGSCYMSSACHRSHFLTRTHANTNKNKKLLLQRIYDSVIINWTMINKAHHYAWLHE